MKKVARVVGRVKRKVRLLKAMPVVSREQYGELGFDARVELIRGLIPLGLMYIREELDREVEVLAGAGMDPVCRAEQIAPEQYLALANALAGGTKDSDSV